ncbi:MAG: MurR/RpiR family transcriptional regulator [Anaerolineae bacterium]|nr:MurR/RpiR family transcriptional regulator [Anaerolineae bacterium]
MDEQLATPDVMAAIRANYDSMSKSQQKVAEFFLTRGLEAVYLPAARIAELLEVSHSTVVRTAQAAGFDGFPNLQSALQEQFLGRFNSASVYQLGSRRLIRDLREQNEDASTATILQRAMLTDARNIENLAAQISIPDFDQTVELLMNAPNVFVIGLRASAPLALNFSIGLRQIRPNCTLLGFGFGDLVDQVQPITEGDVLFAICFGRYMRDTLYCMDHARKAGAKVIAVTDTPLSPAGKRADLVFAVRHGVWFYGASATLFSLLNALIAVLLMRQSARAQQRLESIDSIIEHFQIFEPMDSTNPHTSE